MRLLKFGRRTPPPTTTARTSTMATTSDRARCDNSRKLAVVSHAPASPGPPNERGWRAAGLCAGQSPTTTKPYRRLTVRRRVYDIILYYIYAHTVVFMIRIRDDESGGGQQIRLAEVEEKGLERCPEFVLDIPIRMSNLINLFLALCVMSCRWGNCGI